MWLKVFDFIPSGLKISLFGNLRFVGYISGAYKTTVPNAAVIANFPIFVKVIINGTKLTPDSESDKIKLGLKEMQDYTNWKINMIIYCGYLVFLSWTWPKIHTCFFG